MVNTDILDWYSNLHESSPDLRKKICINLNRLSICIKKKERKMQFSFTSCFALANYLLLLYFPYETTMLFVISLFQLLNQLTSCHETWCEYWIPQESHKIVFSTVSNSNTSSAQSCEEVTTLVPHSVAAGNGVR